MKLTHHNGFQDGLKKDFQQLLKLMMCKNEAYDYYSALKIAQKSTTSYNSDQASLKSTTSCLEELREYFLTILLLDFAQVNLVTLNKTESKVYITALNERLLKLRKELPENKGNKAILGQFKAEITVIEMMLNVAKG